MSKYLPNYLTDEVVYIQRDGIPMMLAWWGGEPWSFRWRENPPGWVSYQNMSNRQKLWRKLRSDNNEFGYQLLSPERADLYHKLAFPELAKVETEHEVPANVRYAAGMLGGIVPGNVLTPEDYECLTIIRKWIYDMEYQS